MRPRAKADAAVQRELDALVRAYKQELPEKLSAMQALAAGMAVQGWDRAVVESLYHETHRLVGSSGVYGLPQLTRAAGIPERLLKELLAQTAWPPARPPAELATLVQAVRQAARPPRGRRGRGPTSGL
jgi:hypothetical protein